MLKKILFTAVFWFLSLPLFGREIQVNIPLECRVPNRTNSQCVWCCIESLSRHHKIPAGYDLTQCYLGECPDINIALNVLRQRKMDGYVHFPGVQNTTALKDYCRRGWGAGVGLGGRHFVNVVHYINGEVYFIDNNDPDLHIRSIPESKFLQHWDGSLITLIPPSKSIKIKVRKK